jgi:hypothetical protein
MPINMTHRVTELDAARRKLLLTRARENASAAQDCLSRLVAYTAGMRKGLERGDLDDAALKAIGEMAQDLRARAEALAVTIA